MLTVRWCRRTVLTNDAPWIPHVDDVTDRGEALRWLEGVLALMDREPLEPDLAPFASVDADGCTRVLGNFYAVSAAFCFVTDEPELAARIDAAIGQNIAGAAYQQAERDRTVYARERAAREGRTHR